MLDHSGTGLLNRVREARVGGWPATGAGSFTDLAAGYEVQAALGKDRPVAGYRLLATGTGHPPYLIGRLYRDTIGYGLISVRGRRGHWLRPVLATVVKHAVPPDATPGAVALAVAGHAFGVEAIGSVWPDGAATLAETVAENAGLTAYLLDERLLVPSASGQIAIHLGPNSITGYADPTTDGLIEQLCWLAGEVGGLGAGQVVVAAGAVLAGSPSRQAVPAGPGLMRAHGPGGSTLVAVVTA